ncbi:hypothetical protein MSAN_00527500 [Mycena sanguinolenta]|uniref:Uncharacterized protein n=1 Tax=Mycena sanguinolenta TaxID=230812 RepID=A0A8H6Z9M1_9AGAR|nr:hypothetical protein MSAN_00527500 [Mycena sanguinolenta]
MPHPKIEETGEEGTRNDVRCRSAKASRETTAFEVEESLKGKHRHRNAFPFATSFLRHRPPRPLCPHPPDYSPPTSSARVNYSRVSHAHSSLPASGPSPALSPLPRESYTPTPFAGRVPPAPTISENPQTSLMWCEMALTDLFDSHPLPHEQPPHQPSRQRAAPLQGPGRRQARQLRALAVAPTVVLATMAECSAPFPPTTISTPTPTRPT